MIEFHGVRFSWRKTDADCLAIEHLDIPSGTSVFLHGPSGSGKSTLLGLLAGVLLPHAGRVCVEGMNWTALSGPRRDAVRADVVGYIFQQFNLLPFLSVLDNVLLPCRFSAQRGERATKRSGSVLNDAKSLLERVGLADSLWDRSAGELSVGQQQRVAAARALVGAPRLVIADEPTSALDADTRDLFMELLLEECKRQGSTLVFVSHDKQLSRHFDSCLSLTEINAASLHSKVAT